MPRPSIAAGVPEVWTIGHSTRAANEFLEVLRTHRVEAVADVRRFPGSRRHPQFGRDALPDTLRAHGIEYAWFQALGGRRRPDPASPNTAWRNPSFRAYADHLASEEFAAGLEELLHMAAACRTAVMCSELLWWRCHRALIADVLRFNGCTVTHIVDADKAAPHPWTSAVTVSGEVLSYAGGCGC